MVDNFSPIPELADKAIYKIQSLPTVGKLKLNGVDMKLGDMFTQDDVNQGRFTYTSIRYDTKIDSANVTFKFSVLHNGAPVTSKTARSLCLPTPEIPIPADGIYEFPIKVLIAWAPEGVARKGDGQWVGNCKSIGKDLLEYTGNRSTPEQLTYTVLGLPQKATLLLSGKPLEANGTFTQADINNGLLTWCAPRTATMDTYFQIKVTNQVGKESTINLFNLHIQDYPYPAVIKNRTEIEECKGAVLTRDMLFSTLTFTAPWTLTPADPAKPFWEEISYNITNNSAITVTPTSFTQKDLDDGKVSFKHNCGPTNLPRKTESLPMSVCFRGNCTTSAFNVYVQPKKVVTIPKPPDVVATDGCLFKKNGSGMDQFCGEWVIVTSGTVPPDPKTMPTGTTIHYTDTSDGAKTVIVNTDKNLIQVPLEPVDPRPRKKRPKKYKASGPIFEGPDGTIWVKTDEIGSPGGPGTSDLGYKPVNGTTPAGGINWDPIMAAQPNVIEVTNPSFAPPGVTKVYNSSIKAFQTYTPLFNWGSWTTNSWPFDTAPFVWMGDNEFYVPNGNTFAIYVMGKRGYVQIDVAGADYDYFQSSSLNNGYSTFYSYSYDTSRYGISQFGNMGNWTDLGLDPASSYIGNGKTNPAKAVTFYKNMGGGRFLGIQRSFTASVNRYLGGNTGSNIPQIQPTRDQYFHFVSGLLAPGDRYHIHAYMPFVYKVRDPKFAAANGGPTQIIPPSNTTWSMDLTATDLITGQKIYRTYKIHWNATGKSANGRSSECTDNMGMGNHGAAPTPGTIVCKSYTLDNGDVTPITCKWTP